MVRQRHHLHATCSLFALALFTSRLDAQAAIGSNGAITSTYVFRGLTLTNTPTLQPKVTVSAPAGGGAFSAWAWGNVEMAVPSTPNALSEGGGVSGINEIDFVAQYAQSLHGVQLTTGAARYVFNGHNRVLTPAYNTTELFVAARGDKLPFTPTVAANWDIETIHGVYAEAAASQTLRLGSSSTVLGVLAGWSFGQEQRDVNDVYFAYAQRGLTHVDLSATQSLSAMGLALTPAVHVQWAPEGQNTRALGALPSASLHATKLWLILDVGWAKRLGSVAAR